MESFYESADCQRVKSTTSSCTIIKMHREMILNNLTLRKEFRKIMIFKRKNKNFDFQKGFHKRNSLPEQIEKRNISGGGNRVGKRKQGG
jgi:hypothetical protein